MTQKQLDRDFEQASGLSIYLLPISHHHQPFSLNFTRFPVVALASLTA